MYFAGEFIKGKGKENIFSLARPSPPRGSSFKGLIIIPQDFSSVAQPFQAVPQNPPRLESLGHHVRL
jgi:hypothetical protein